MGTTARPGSVVVAAIAAALAVGVAACVELPSGGGGEAAPASTTLVTGSAQIEVIPPDTLASETESSESGPPAPPVARPTASSVNHSVVAQAVVASVVVRDQPSLDASVVSVLANPIPSGSPLVFRAVDGGAASADWLQVFLPIEPNGSMGWVLRADVTLADNPYRIEIDRADYALRVYDLDELWIETTIAVGNGATPTPVGEFYLMELLAPPDPGGPYGPFAFGLSGFSEVLDGFAGSDVAIIGLHGTNDPASLGTDVSHGCVRLDNGIISELAQTLPLGTPVKIT